MFFNRNTSKSTDVGFRLACCLLTILPVLENSHSEVTEVARIPKFMVSLALGTIVIPPQQGLVLMSTGGILSRRGLRDTTFTFAVFTISRNTNGY